ncbi:MAG: hypothetical protein M3025_03730 [Actinomycetota bacterium]|nr:hypothetical protein [Actinomycetota bacterium]
MRQRWLGVSIVLIACSVALSLSTAPALADGDPASDVLLGQNVYYPYTPAVSTALQKQLDSETAAAAKAHFPVKVALIESAIDLGVIPQLFGKPQLYAKYLDQEISFQGPQVLLVVMKAGYGIEGMTPAARTALATLPLPAQPSSNGLAQAALSAVTKLAQAEGHPLPTPSVAGNGSGGSSLPLIVAVALAAVVAAGTLTALRHRRAPARRS